MNDTNACFLSAVVLDEVSTSGHSNVKVTKLNRGSTLCAWILKGNG